MSEKIAISPETKLGKLLENFPQLKDELISISPAYAKLKNPVLRKTIGKVATLRQVAEVGNIPVAELINRLRKKAGIGEEYSGKSGKGAEFEKPKWFNLEEISKRLDARPIIEAGGHPLEQMMKELKNLEPGKIYELTTPFFPAPLIDMVKSKGYQVWTEQADEQVIKNYFYKS